MSYLLKDPAAALDYAVAWGAEYLSADELIIASRWTVGPSEPDGINVVDANFSGQSTVATVTGGVAGKLYRLSNIVETNAGRVDERTIHIRVEER